MPACTSMKNDAEGYSPARVRVKSFCQDNVLTPHPGGGLCVTTRFQVRALVSPLLFLSEHVDLRAWSFRTVASNHYKALNASKAGPEEQQTSRDLLDRSRPLKNFLW
jgi:hypothetical protein